MTERPSEPDQSTMPEDIATLYSRAHIQGTRYWDFSASRKEVRGQLRHRASAAKAPAPLATAPRELSQTIPFHAQSQETSPRAAAAPSTEPRPHIETTAPSSSRSTMPVIHKAGETREQGKTAEQGARWYALQSVFSPAEVLQPPTQPVIVGDQPPLMAVFSLAGGVGKTCLVATLGRALSSLGERVLLADTAACGLLPFYFGSRDLKPGVVRTFSPPASGIESEAPVHVLNLEAEHYPDSSEQQDPFLDEILRGSRNASRVLVDVATASREVTRRLLRLRPAVLVPLLPDMSSVASLSILENLLGRGGEGSGQIFYLLNQFDASSPLHQDLRDLLQQRLGDRLLPFVLSRSAAVSEALAEGMTVIDYAPGSPAAEDYWNLAGWLRSFAAPAAVGFGGVRWSER